MKTKIFIFALVLLGLVLAAQVTTYGTIIFAHNGTAANQANVSMYNYSGGGGQQVKTLQNTTLTNASGWFNITYEDSSLMLEFKVTWTNSTGAVAYASNTLPIMPFSEINSTLHTIQNYNISIGLVPAAILNLSAVNVSNEGTGFAYSLRDLEYGMEVSSNSSVSPLTNVTITLIANKNYSLYVWQSGNMIGVNQGITIVPIQYIINGGNLTDSTLANGTFTMQMNFTQALANVSGNVSIIGNSTEVSFQAGFFPADVIGTEWIIHYGPGRTPFTIQQSGNYIDSWNGNYSLSIPTGVQATNYILFMSANDTDKNYFGAFQNFTMTTLGTNYPSDLNLTLRAMNGTFVDTLGMNFGTTDVNSSKNVFYINSSTGSIMNQSAGMELLFNITAPASFLEPVTYTMMVRSNDSGAFIVPLINSAANVSLKVFSMGAAPKEITINMSTLTNPKYINLLGSAMQAGSGGGALGNLNITFYYSNSTCDIPESPSGCAVATMEIGSGGSPSGGFHPLAFTLAGRNVSIRTYHIPSGTMVKYYNVNLIASGPPDVSMDTSPTESSSGSAFSGFQRFGSMGPRVFDNASVSLPYSDTELVDSSPITVVLSKLYDEDWNQIWNSTDASYGNSVGANVPAHYADYYNVSNIFNESNKLPCSTSVQTSTCYVNTGANRIWVTIPHFSGGGYGYSGTAYSAPTTLQSSSDDQTSITMSTSFDCTTKKLLVTISSALNSGNIKLVDKTGPPFQDTVLAEISDGKTSFTISESGTYKLIPESLPSTYTMTEKEVVIDLSDCPESSETACTTSSDCLTTEQCTANECVAVTGTCGYATSHAWVSYECCADSDCAADEVCTENVCEETGGIPDFIDEIIEQAAIDAINEATSAIEAGKAAGKDTSDAEAKLAEAQAAYDSGDPDLAESLARESIELIKEPQAEEQPEEDQTEEATEESTEEKGTDYSMILYLVGAIIILFLLYKFVLKGRKGYRK